MNIGLVIADAGRARIFATERLGSPLESIKDLINPYGKQREQSFTSDRSGHTNSPSGTGHTMSNKAEFKAMEDEQFAKSIVSELEENYRDGKFVAVYLLAAPRFLGRLRNELTPAMKKVVVREYAKDFSLMNERELQKHLALL